MAKANSIDTPVPSTGQSSQPVPAGILRDQLAWTERMVSEGTEQIRAVAFGALQMLRHGDHIDHVYVSIAVITEMADTLAANVQSVVEQCGIEVKDDDTAWNNSASAQRRWEVTDHA